MIETFLFFPFFFLLFHSDGKHVHVSVPRTVNACVYVVCQW